VYDAVYVALAVSLDAPGVTAEKTTTPWVVKLGDRVRSIAYVRSRGDEGPR
jgi:hypothetical protein